MYLFVVSFKEEKNDEAMEYAEKLAYEGNSMGQFLLGRIPSDAPTARYGGSDHSQFLIRQAQHEERHQTSELCSCDKPSGHVYAGNPYEAGKGVEKNMAEAVSYMKKSADMDYGQVECALADMYCESRGVDKSYDKAVEWYAKADAHGCLNENAAKRYAACYENGWGGLVVDKERLRISSKATTRAIHDADGSVESYRLIIETSDKEEDAILGAASYYGFDTKIYKVVP